jgi:hypothetical protein
MAAPVRGQQPQHAGAAATAVDPLEYAVVQQIEWYLGRQNLETDYFLKHQMDMDLWVPLSVILSFPKMQLLQVTDPAVVAALLERASTIVEVDSSRTRIRPAWARCSVLALTLPNGTVIADVEALFNQKLNTPRPTSVVLISPVDGLWHCTFSGPEDAAVAMEIVADLSILSEKVLAHVHSSGLQSLILGTQLGGPAGAMQNVPGLGSGSHDVTQGFYDGSGGSGQGVSMGLNYSGGIPQGMMAPHLPIPIPNVPGAPNYGFMSGNAFPAGAGPAASGYGAQSGFLHSPRTFVQGNYYMTPYGHQVPYDASTVGAQQHPLSPSSSAANGVISPTAQMQAAEAAARAAAEAGHAAGNVNPGGVGSMPKGAGGHGGHHVAVGAGGTSGAAVSVVSTSSSPDGMASMHQGHLRGLHNGRRSSQRHGHGQQHGQQNGVIGAVNGLPYHQSGFDGSMPSAASRTGASHSTKGMVSPSGVSNHGMVSGSSAEQTQGKALHGVGPVVIGNGASGVNRSRSIQNGGGPVSVHSPGMASDATSHQYRGPKLQGAVINDGSTRTNSMGKKNKKKANSTRHVPGSGNSTPTSNGTAYINVAGVDARGGPETIDTTRDESKRLVVEDDRKSDDTKGSNAEPNFTAMHFPPLPGAVESAATEKSPKVRVSQITSVARAPGVVHVTGSAGNSGQEVLNSHEPSALASTPNEPLPSKQLDSPAERLRADPQTSPSTESNNSSSMIGRSPASSSGNGAGDVAVRPSRDQTKLSPTACATSTNAVEDRHHHPGSDTPLVPSTGLTYAAILRAKAKKRNVASPSTSTATSPVSGGHAEASLSANGNVPGAISQGQGAVDVATGVAVAAASAGEISTSGSQVTPKPPPTNNAGVLVTSHAKVPSGSAVKGIMAVKPDGSLRRTGASGDSPAPNTGSAPSTLAEGNKPSSSSSTGPVAPRSVWANKPQSVLQAAAVSKSPTGKAVQSTFPSTIQSNTSSSGSTESSPAVTSAPAVSHVVAGSVVTPVLGSAGVDKAAAGSTSYYPSESGLTSGSASNIARNLPHGKPQHGKYQPRALRPTSEGSGTKSNTMNGSSSHPKGAWAQGSKVWSKGSTQEKIAAKSDP